MWKNTVEPGRPRMTTWLMRTACWITKATDTHSECVIFIAFVLQQWLLERASMLRCTYIACLVIFNVSHPRCVYKLVRGVSLVKQHNLVIKMLYSISETTCFGQKLPSSGFYAE